ncbi:hypothetical protein GF324_10035, partial [bacterium]|nr:hypothetical protein [bacterium]
MAITEDVFLTELEACAVRVQDYLLQDRFRRRFHPKDIEEAARLYVKAGGKRLRPAILLWSCGALGGDEEKAMPAAGTVEIFHTWTLVHDDIIDRDERRRGSATVHEQFRQVALDRYRGISSEEARHYGTSVAVLGGDVQHGWCVSMLSELSRMNGIDARLTLELIHELDSSLLNLLVEGELLDLQFSHEPIDRFKVEDIEDMLWKKTGVLYRYCAGAGAQIALGRWDPEHEHVQALQEYAGRCGIAFQLQDDVLGIVGDADKLGKPVGSDIREGKRTT